MKLSHLSSTLIYGVFGLLLSNIVYAVPLDLVETLVNENFDQRVDAEKKLSAWVKGKDEKVYKELERMKEKAKSPEVKMRLGNVIDNMQYDPIPNTRGYIGISMNALMGGVTINRVQPNTPAQKHGLLFGDVIVGIDDVDLTKKNQHIDEAMNFLRDYVKTKNSGAKLTLELRRDGKKLTKKLKLADYDKAQVNGVPLNQQGLQLLPQPNGGGNLRFRMQIEGDPEVLKMQLEAQEMLEQMLEQQMEMNPELKNFIKKPAERFKDLMLKTQQERLERMQKELENLQGDKKPADK